jgi:AAA15 family ATPase/GTPase
LYICGKYVKIQNRKKMIQSLSIKNFLSFKDEVSFSFEATKDKKLEEYHVVEAAPGVRLLKLGLVYGANASGKSNLIYAFEFLREIWEHTPKSKDDYTQVIPFLLDKNTPNEPTSFRLVFYVHSMKYIYLLEINKEKILKENLVYYPGTQPALIFDRYINNSVSEIEFGAKIKISPLAREEINLKCLPNMSVFAAYNQVNISISELVPVSEWIRNGFMHVVDPNVNLIDYAENITSRNPTIETKVLSFLQKADFNISGTRFKETDDELAGFKGSSSNYNDVQLNGTIIHEAEIKYLIKKKLGFMHKIINAEGKEEFYIFPKHLQSAGTLRSFGLSVVILQALKNNAFLSIDEIESKLHPRLIEYVIENFLKDSAQAQLLLTTHYDGLLEEDDLLRKDNIWFTDKRPDGSTNLYSLSDFNAVNRISSLQKAYKYGKFGAIPNIE